MKEIDALIKLIQDDDPQIVAMSMEKLLTMDEFVNVKLPELQESSNPKLRLRMHQFASILNRRKKMSDFLDRVKDNKLDSWIDLVFLNKIFDHEVTTASAAGNFEHLCSKVKTKEMNAFELSAFMKENNFSTPSEDILDPSLFLINEVIICGLGNSLLLASIASLVAAKFNARFSIVLHKGRHCLVDENRMFIDPQNNWSVNQLPADSRVYPCSNKSILLTIISQLYLSALMEGHLRVIYQLSKMMAALSDSKISDFPYPVGDVGIPEDVAVIS